jgi:hypothetical protein
VRRAADRYSHELDARRLSGRADPGILFTSKLRSVGQSRAPEASGHGRNVGLGGGSRGSSSRDNSQPLPGLVPPRPVVADVAHAREVADLPGELDPPVPGSRIVGHSSPGQVRRLARHPDRAGMPSLLAVLSAMERCGLEPDWYCDLHPAGGFLTSHGAEGLILRYSPRPAAERCRDE